MTTERNAAAAKMSEQSLAQKVAQRAFECNANSLPPETFAKAELHLLDTLGLALASYSQDFAKPSLAGIFAAAGQGDCFVIGSERRLAARDAAFANGLLMHGLDFDDTHLASIIHASVASLPAALAMAEHLDASWDDMLCAYILGMEVSIRLGASVQGGFHHVGFHATGIVSHFSSAVVAGKLLGLDPDQLCAAQGVAASTTSGVQAFLEEGAWTKRMHPGWGALAGVTAAYMVQAGFVAPTRPYEARFGLYDTHLHETKPLPALLVDTFGQEWRMLETAIKPYPICHFSHGCTEAAIALSAQLAGRIDEIAEVTAFLPEPTLHIVAEPPEAKQNVTTDYGAKFSAQFCVAMGLIKGRFGLKELTAEALANTEVQTLTRKVVCEADSASQFPKYFSGRLTVKLKDGTIFNHDVPINKGAGDRSMSAEDITEKFLANAQLKLTPEQAAKTLDILRHARTRSVRAVLQDIGAVESPKSIPRRSTRRR